VVGVVVVPTLPELHVELYDFESAHSLRRLCFNARGDLLPPPRIASSYRQCDPDSSVLP
jgi:hypothetical protein